MMNHATKNPRVYLLCGFIGSGKTTAAIELVRSVGAIRMTLDEWVNRLYGPEAASLTDFDPQERVKEVMWQTTQGILQRGMSVVLDWGFWTRKERDAYRARCDAHGFACTVIFIRCEKNICRERVRERNIALDERSVSISLADFERWWPMFEPPVDEVFDEWPDTLGR